MKLQRLRSLLQANPDAHARFVLPSGDEIPAHYHLTEVGHVAKNFIDCGGTIRKSEACVLQLWVDDDDTAHRLTAGKFGKILGLGARVLPAGDLDVEVEWDCCVASQYPIADVKTSGGELVFTLASKHTACRARETCGCGPAPNESASLATVCC